MYISAFLGSSLGKSNVEIMLGAVLNYNNLFLFMMTCPSVMQLFSVRQERSGSLLIVCQMEGRESSCLLFSTLPFTPVPFPNQCTGSSRPETGNRGTRSSASFFSSKNWLQNTVNNCSKLLNSIHSDCNVNFKHLKSNLQPNNQNYLIMISEIIST